MKSSKARQSRTSGAVRNELSRFVEKAHRLAHTANDLHQRVKNTHDRAHRMHEMERLPLRKRAPGKEVNWTMPE